MNDVVPTLLTSRDAITYVYSRVVAGSIHIANVNAVSRG